MHRNRGVRLSGRHTWNAKLSLVDERSRHCHRFATRAWYRHPHKTACLAGRECLAPEVSRNKNIGAVGANMKAATFKRYLSHMAWANERDVRLGDLSYLQHARYHDHITSLIAQASLWTQPVTTSSLKKEPEGRVNCSPCPFIVFIHKLAVQDGALSSKRRPNSEFGTHKN